MIVFTVISFLTPLIAAPDQLLISHMGIGLFIGFWARLFFGATGALGLHHRGVETVTNIAVVVFGPNPRTSRIDSVEPRLRAA